MVNECLRWGAFAALVVPVALLLTGGSTRTAAISGAATAGLTGLIFVLTRLTHLRLPYLDRTESPPEPEPVEQPWEPEERWEPVHPPRVPTLPSPLAPGAYDSGFDSYVDDHGYGPPLEPRPYAAPPYGLSAYDALPYDPAPYDPGPYDPGPYGPAVSDPRLAADYDLPAYGPPYDAPPYEAVPDASSAPYVHNGTYAPAVPGRWPPADWDPFPAYEDAPRFAEEPGLDPHRNERRRARRRAP